jgi:methylglutaconyl-CoA hydratase
VTTLTLDSQHNRNALSPPLIAQLRDRLAAAADDDNVRAVVLDHAGPVFCSGADLADPAAAMALLPDLLADVWECPKPVVARIAGPARAGGIGLIGAVDIAICATDATFAFTEVRLGVIPAVISATVLPRLTPRAAARFYLTGETFGGEHAALVGLVSEAVPATALDPRVADICEALVRGAPAALAGTKQLLQRGSIRARLAELAETSIAYFRSADAREGIAAFRERRDPSWAVAIRG